MKIQNVINSLSLAGLLIFASGFSAVAHADRGASYDKHSYQYGQSGRWKHGYPGYRSYGQYGPRDNLHGRYVPRYYQGFGHRYQRHVPVSRYRAHRRYDRRRYYRNRRHGNRIRYRGDDSWSIILRW
ncbi:MAG: hypothetical protein BMS9Abin26_0022 [Gammaproteobacteria bacterium]|nr:MAG: hypothetical protein BMS9Abin26_0022 [Gammaproteobacteria bacterium]